MPRIYTLPDFNLVGDHWFHPRTPAMGVADEVDIPCQLYLWYGNPINQFNLTIRIPKGSSALMVFGDMWEIPQGSGRYYRVNSVGIIHQGFPNEYWISSGPQTDQFGTNNFGKIP